MKIVFNEHPGCYELYMTAENEQDIRTLARFGLNKTKELRHLSVTFGETEVYGSIIIGRKKNPSNSL